MGAPDPLAVALRDAGRAMGFTQEEMCVKAGLDKNVLMRALTGKTAGMRLTSARLLAEVVGCDIVLRPRPEGGETT